MRSTEISTRTVSQLVPTVAVDVLSALGVEVDVSEVLVEVDGRDYVDLRLVSSEDASRLSGYWERCLEFWDLLEAGEEPGPYSATRRLIRTAQQRDNQDLSAEAAVLEEVAGVGAVIAAALESNPDWEDLTSRATAAGAALTRNEGETTITAVIGRDESLYWPQVLGGALAPGEMARELVVFVRHAAWRDRKIRRLTRVQVYAHELWPQPELRAQIS